MVQRRDRQEKRKVGMEFRKVLFINTIDSSYAHVQTIKRSFERQGWIEKVCNGNRKIMLIRLEC